ncbi:MAG: hypothetical protein DDT35_01458 [Firmicutes bacterium]|nr:hypothetical protein [Bacillota bacterium]
MQEGADTDRHKGCLEGKAEGDDDKCLANGMHWGGKRDDLPGTHAATVKDGAHNAENNMDGGSGSNDRWQGDEKTVRRT